MLKTIYKINRTDEVAKHYGFKKIDINSTRVEDIFLDPRQKNLF